MEVDIQREMAKHGTFPMDLETPPGVPFYRCTLCGGVVSVWDIEEVKGCPKCACPRIKPTNLSLREKVIQIIKHPKIWKWKERYR